MTDVQNCTDQVLDSSTAISGGTISYQVLNVTQPVFAAFKLLRWQNDLTANYTSAQSNAVYGRNWFNCNGWLQPAGTSLPLQPMFVNYYAKSGNNNLVYQASIYDFLDDKSIRYFKNGASAVRGIPAISYAHVPTAPNTCSGSVDFSVVNQPIDFWQFATSPPYATIALWAAQDIGFSSNLVISGVYFTYNNVDVTNYDIIRTACLISSINFHRALQLRRFLRSCCSRFARCAPPSRGDGSICYATRISTGESLPNRSRSARGAARRATGRQRSSLGNHMDCTSTARARSSIIDRNGRNCDVPNTVGTKKSSNIGVII
jgi:hypothetical protein